MKSIHVTATRNGDMSYTRGSLYISKDGEPIISKTITYQEARKLQAKLAIRKHAVPKM